jgi:CHASE2 domain-containing sensor protein
MLRRGALLFPLLVLFAGASLIREASVGILQRAEEYWKGLLITKPRPAGPALITLIEISDDTTLKHVWPWAAADFAVFFHAALPFEPATIAVEPVLDADRGALAGEEREEIYEKMLHDGILRAPKLVLGGRLGFSPDAETAQPLQPMPVLAKVSGDLSKVQEFAAVESWAEERFRLSTKPGWTNLPNSLGPLGRCPLLFRYRGQPVPSIALQLAMFWEKVTPDEVEIVLGSHITLGKKRVPIDESGRMVVNFGIGYERVAYDDLLLVREQLDQGEAPSRPAEIFKNRVLLLGRTDTFVRNISTATGAKITPSELFASAVATIQTEAFPRRIGSWFDWLLIFAVAAASVLIPRSRAVLFGIVVVGVTSLVYLGAFALYRSSGLILPGVLPIGLALWMLALRVVARKAQRVIAF